MRDSKKSTQDLITSFLLIIIVLRINHIDENVYRLPNNII